MNHLDYSPNRNDVTCPECEGSWHWVISDSGPSGQYLVYYCDNHVELMSEIDPKGVAGNEQKYCSGMAHVYENGRVTVGAGDTMNVIKEGETANM
jgi:hypothetical protein